MIHQRGDTVKLLVSFHDFGDNPIAPDEVKIVIYNDRYEVLIEQLLTDGNKISDGKGGYMLGEYYYDFTLTDYGVFYYEFSGLLHGRPVLRRGKLKSAFYE